jgi:hypothetical protein
MNMQVLEIATDEELLKSLRNHTAHRPSQDELLQQRVSYVYGALKSDSGITKEQIKRILVERDA